MCPSHIREPEVGVPALDYGLLQTREMAWVTGFLSSTKGSTTIVGFSFGVLALWKAGE